MKSPILKALILSFSFIILLSTSLSEAQTLEPIFNPSMTPIAFGPSDSALGEGIDNVIDGSKSNKFLTFEKSWGLNFYVDTEELSIVKSLTITTANDHPERDPKLIKIYGRNVPSGTNSTDTKPGWTLIDEVSFRCRDLNEARRADNTEDVDNDLAYNSYWIRLHNPCDASEANSVQISEVQLYGIFNQAPSVIFDATGTGGAEVGKEITAIYEYSDPEDDPESGTTFQWYLDNVAIEGATSVSYMPTIDDLGSELKVKITPNDGTSTGTEVLSLIGIINCSAGFTCEVQNVSICDSNTYQVPGGDLVSTTGTYEVTEGTVKTYYNVSFDRSDVTSDVYTNGLIAESGLVTYTANTQATGILTFDKSQDYWVNMNALQDDLDGTNRSVFMWVKSEADVVSDDQTLFAINTASGGNVALFKIDNDGENLELFDGSDNQSASFDMGDEQWHYVGYTYDAATTETVIYVDGIENDRFKDNQSTVNDSQYSLGQEFDNANDSDHMNGDMAEISIWNEVLTGAEIREAMQAKINNGHPKYANLVGYYSVFGDCDDDTAVLKDHSGKGNDGVMVNGLTVDFQNVQSIPGFNAIDWYEHISWKKDGAEVSTDPTYTFDVAAGSYELVATRNFVQSTDSWTMTLNSNATTVDIIADETLCADDPITRTVSTSTVNYLDFEETEGNFIEVNPVVNDIAGKSYSVFMWLNKESNIGTDDFNEVLVFQDSDVDNLSRFYFRDTERLALWDGTNDRLNSSVLSNDTWYFVGYTYDNATGETKLYLNGNVEDSGTLDMPLGEGWMATLGAKYNDNGLEDHLDGKMAEITIWDKVLTQEEVTSLMGSAPVHDAANLVAAYGTHKNIADNQLRDLTANGNNGLASHQTIIINNLEEVIPGYDASAHYTFSWKKGGIEFDTDAIGNITVEEGTIAYSVTYGTPLFQKSDDFSLSYTNLLPTQPVSKTAGALGSVTFEVDEIAGASYQWYERKEGLQVDTRISSAVTDIKESENFVYYQGSSSLFIENKDDGNIQTFSFPSITGVLEHDGYIYVTSKTHGLYVSSIGNIIFDNITEEDGLISDTGTGILVTSTGVVVMIHGDDPDEGIQHTHISQINYDQNSYPDLRVGRASYNSIVEFKNKVYVIDSDLFDEYKVNNNNTDFVMKFPEDINQAGRSLLVEKITSNSNVVVGYTHNNTVFITSDIENASNYTQLTVPISYRRGIQDIHLTSDRLYVATSGDGIFELDLNNIAEGLIQNQDYDLTTTAVGVVGGNIEVGLSTGIQSFEDRTTLSNNSDNTAINQIQGATTHQLTINNLSLDENAAEYFVEVTLGECTQPSDNVTLSVLDVPAVLSQSPSNESTDVAIDTQLSIEFSKTVSKGSGELKIYNYSTDALVQTFTADDLTIDGTTVSVASGVSLGYATQYYITLGADLVKDESDAGNLALTNKDTWSFHTVCEPLIITEPEDQSGLVGGSATFSVPEVAGASYQWFNKNDRTDELLNNIGSIASVSATSSGIFVGAATGLYRSTDNGESFSQLNDSTNINVVFEKNGTLYVGYESGLGISTDNGETFSIKTTTNSDLPSNDIANISVFDNTLYLSISDASSNGGVIVSTDNGESFERKTLSDGLGSNEVYDVFGAGDNIYVATKSGLSISTNGGESFENKTTANGLKTNTVRHVVVSSNGTIYAGTTAGMSISTDGGVTFIDMPTNGELASSVVRDLEIKNDLAYIAVRSTSGGAGIYTTTDGGQTLNTIFEEGFGGYRSVVISVLNGKVYAGGVGSILLSHSSTSPLVSGIDAAANNYIIGAASASLTINNLTEDVDQTQYFVVVTKGECEETSNVAALTVTEGLGSISYTSLSPSNEATAVSLTPTVSLTLSEAVQKGTGTIELRKSSDDQLVTSLEANSDQVAITDNTVTLGLGDLSLDYGTSYYLIIPNTAFTDGNGKQFVGIDDKNTWSFITTCDGLISSELIDKTAALGESVTFTINEIPGATYQWKKSFSGIFGNLSDEAGKIQGATTNSLTISNLEASDNGSRYLLLVTAENCSENSNVAVINLEQSAELLEIKSLNPADGSSDLEAESLNTTIPNSNKFWITFSEGVKYGNTSAEYKLYTSADDQLVASQTLLSTLAGPPVGNTTAGFGFYNYTFEPGTSYYILMDAGMYKSVANDEEFPGITDKTTWSFTTKVSDVEPLEVTSTFPSATRDALLDFPYLNIEFAEQIALGTGEVTIYRASDNSVFETLDISTGRVKNSGSPLQVQLALSQNWEEGVSYYIQYPKGLITSLDGSKELQAINDKTSLAFKAESFNENIITNFFPATGSSTYVADSEDDLVIYTSVGVALERDPLGSFRIYKAANDELVKTIEYDGENERDLDYGDDEGYIKFEFDDDELEPGTEYYVLVDDGFIISYEEGLYHVGISDPTTWRFTTLEEPTTPKFVSSNPASGATDVAISANIELTYSENIQAYVYGEARNTTNNIVLYDANDNEIESFPANSDRLSYSGSKVTINPTNNLNYNTTYYVLIDDEAFVSNNEVESEGVLDPTTISFTTAGQPNTAPLASNVAFTGNLEANQELSGSYDYSDVDTDAESGSTIQWFMADDATGANRTAISGATSSTFTLTSAEVGKFITFGVTPNDGTDAGTRVLATYDGPVVAAVVPTLVSTSPADGALDVLKDANLSLTLSEAITAGTGNITLSPVNGAATVIDVTSAEVTILGTDVTINPASDLLDGEFYTVTFDAAAFVDADGNNSAGLTSQTTWNFTVKEANVAPEAQGVSIKQSIVVSEMLEGSYTFFDQNDDTESGTTYQWYRADDVTGTGRTAIAGATAQNYTVVNDDNNKFISFEVTPNDGSLAGAAEESTFFGPVLINDGITNIPPAFTSDALTSVLDNAAYSYTVTYEDLNNDVPTLTKTTGPDWLSVNGFVLSGNPTSANIGNHSIVLTLDDGNGGTKTQEFTVNVLQSNTAPSVNGVEITGTTTIDEVLTATYNFIDAESDADNSSFKWYRSDDSSGTGKTAISGATTTSYTLVAADAGKFISFEVTPNDGTVDGTIKESILLGSVAKKIPTLSLSDIAKTYGDADFDLSATTNSSGTISYTFNNDQTGAGINGATVTLGNVGEITVNVSLAEDAEYAARQVQGTITVAKKAIALKATDAGKVVDDTDPTLEFTVTSGAIIGEDEVVTVSRDAGEAPGIYAINLIDGADAANYEIAAVPGVFTISQRNLTITAQAAIKTYGDADPTFNYSITEGALENGDELSGGITRVEGEDVGTYALQGSLYNPEYKITFVSADLTIGKATLTATADDKSKAYGEENPELTISYSGFVNGDTKADITEPTAATVANASSPIGTYDIALSGGAATNYNINLVNGQLTVEQRPFITTWEITSNDVNRSRTFFNTLGSHTYLYDIDWGDGAVETDQTGAASHTYVAEGTYTVKISGQFPQFELPFSRLRSVEQWGDIEWKSMEGAFVAAEFDINATDAPKLSQVTSMKRMFERTFIGNPDLTSWDVANITDMSEMFKESDFNGDISGWDVSAVTDMSYMFAQAENFNSSISNWNTSAVQNMSYMFYYAQSFNQSIDAWDVSSVALMSSMFADAAMFNQDLNSWDVSSVTKMDKMFDNALLFNGDITGWNVSGVTDMSNMFDDAKAFNQDINGWDVSNVTRMNAMFNDADVFNQDLNSWDVSKVETFQAMFQNNDTFNGNISNWDVSNATKLERMFEDAHAFNQDIGNWQPTNAENLTAMFRDARSFNQNISSWRFPNADRLNQMFYEAAAFNQDISSWETGNIVDMSSMFENAESFNQNIGSWDVSSVTNFGSMFRGASVFDQDISEWDMSAATSMNSMFKNASAFNQNISGWNLTTGDNGITSMNNLFENATAFDQDLSAWDISGVRSLNSIFSHSGMSVANYDATLIGWAAQQLQSDVNFGVEGLQYCAGAAARQSLIDNLNWTIENDSQSCNATVTIADVSANEDDGAITVTLTSDAFVVDGFTVDVSTSNGTAEAGTDYTAVTAETITFAGTVGETQSFTITPTADSSVESDETLTVSMSNLVTDASNTVTITDEATITILNDDNEAPVVTNAIISGIAQVNQTLTGSYTYADAEGDVENGTTFQWYTGTDSPLATIYETVTLEDHEFQAPNAKGGQESFLDILNNKVYSEDFISNTADPISPTVDVVFGVGMGFILYPVSTYDSDVYNLNGFGTKNGTKLSLTNLNPTDLSSLSTEADVTNLIESQNLTFTEARVDLGQEGPNNNGVGAIIAFELVSSRGLTQGLIEIESLDDTNQSVVVNIYIGETSDERIIGGLTPITGATSAELILTEDLVGESVIFGITPANAEGTGDETFSEAIGPIQALPQVQFTSTAKSVDESVSTASIEVMLSQAGLVASTVDYTITGTATGGGVDYTLANGTLSFAAGELSKTIDLTIVDDALIEENETVVITLSNASGASLGTNTVFTYTIVNNDAQVTIEDVSQFEDGESFLITATLEGTIEGGFTVDLSTADGTATVADGDYTAVSGATLTFSGTDGETQQLDIAPGVDSKLEADETFTVSLSNLAGTTANVVITDQAVLTIKNDDAAAVILADASGNEGDGAITVTATLDNAVQGGFTLEVNTTDGIATLADNDYKSVAGKTLTFAGTAGETQTFTVTPINDLVIEANETLTVSMSKLSTALGVDISDGATVTIVNDDFNNFPTDITISASSIAENNALDAAIGTLTTSDADAGNTHTYALVSGAGDIDNASFTVDGSTLKANSTSFNFEDKASYSVRVETNDGEGGTFAKAFEITVTNVNEAPFTLSLTNATIEEGDEVQEVGQLMSLDPDNGDTFTYSLVAGNGDADNAQFAISGNTLSTAGAIDFEDGASRSIRVQVADAGGLTFEQTFSITIEDVVAEPVREYTQNEPGADVKNVFSPNGDGVNETWVIEDLLDNPFNQVKIFAQGGKLIYSKVNYSNDWAGTFKDNPVPDGTYYYEILIYADAQSTTPARTIKGFLTIIRNR